MTKSMKTDKAPPTSSSLPDRWHIVRFGDVAKKISDIVDRKNSDLDHFVAGEHMLTDDFRIKEWGTIDDGYLGPAFNHKFSKGQILYGSRRTYLRKVSLPHFDGVCANTTFVIEPTGDDLVPELLPFVMQSAGFNEQSIRMSKGSTNPYINWKDIACYEFAVPEKEQQRRIATTLWAAEYCIVKGERFVEKAERAKQVMMQELFSKGIGHTDFKEVAGFGIVPKDWEISTLKSHLIDYRDGAPLTPRDFVKEGFKVIPKKAVVRGGILDIKKDGQTYTTPQFMKKYESSVVNMDYLITTLRDLIPSGPNIGLIVKIPTDEKYILAQGVYGIKLKKSIFIDYIIQYSQSAHYRKIMQRIKVGSTQVHIRNDDFFSFKFMLPPLPEQRQIAGILTRCDETIAAARANVMAAKALKMRLINDMLAQGK